MRKVFSLLIIVYQFSISVVCATVMVKQFSIEEMTQRSDTVVTGIIQNVEYRMNDRNQIFTYVTVEATDVLKGSPQNTVFEVIEIGGKTDRYTTAIYGAPSYEKDEEVVLFLRDHIEKVELKRIVALKQGKYSIVEDEQTGQKFAVTDLHGIDFVEQPAQPAQPTHVHSDGETIRIPLDELIHQIRTAVQEQAIQQDESYKESLEKQQRRFDWAFWLRKKIIEYANKMGATYKRYVSDTQRS